MDIKELLKRARYIWGDDKLSLDEILIRQGVTIGDLHRLARDYAEGQSLNEAELKKELGNVIFSTIRWCDDLGYSPEECIELAKQAQIKYRQART
jgi:hypothetical protein